MFILSVISHARVSSRSPKAGKGRKKHCQAFFECSEEGIFQANHRSLLPPERVSARTDFFDQENDPTYITTNYATLKSKLVATGEGDVLPATDPSGGGTWYVPTSYARMLGLSSTTPAADTTVTLNTYYSWDFTQDVVNGLEHELSEGELGRIGDLGGTGGLTVGESGGGPYTGAGTPWSTMDLFSYSAEHSRLLQRQGRKDHLFLLQWHHAVLHCGPFVEQPVQ
jgi:hypothetical protein